MRVTSCSASSRKRPATLADDIFFACTLMLVTYVQTSEGFHRAPYRCLFNAASRSRGVFEVALFRSPVDRVEAPLASPPPALHLRLLCPRTSDASCEFLDALAKWAIVLSLRFAAHVLRPLFSALLLPRQQNGDLIEQPCDAQLRRSLVKLRPNICESARAL